MPLQPIIRFQQNIQDCVSAHTNQTAQQPTAHPSRFSNPGLVTWSPGLVQLGDGSGKAAAAANAGQRPWRIHPSQPGRDPPNTTQPRGHSLSGPQTQLTPAAALLDPRSFGATRISLPAAQEKSRQLGSVSLLQDERSGDSGEEEATGTGRERGRPTAEPGWVSQHRPNMFVQIT